MTNKIIKILTNILTNILTKLLTKTLTNIFHYIGRLTRENTRKISRRHTEMHACMCIYISFSNIIEVFFRCQYLCNMFCQIFCHYKLDFLSPPGSGPWPATPAGRALGLPLRRAERGATFADFPAIAYWPWPAARFGHMLNFWHPTDADLLTPPNTHSNTVRAHPNTRESDQLFHMPCGILKNLDFFANWFEPCFFVMACFWL